MELIIDTASVKDIRELNEIFMIDGVTCNPSIVCKEQKDFNVLMQAIVAELKEEQTFFAEVLADNCDEMVKEAEYINSLKNNAYAKIPVSEEGLKAIKICHQKGIKTLATAVFTSLQGFLAAKNGAEYIAPYVNRMDNYMDGVEETLILQDMLRKNKMDSKVIAASFKNVNQIKQLIAYGIDSITITPEMFRKMYVHAGTDDAIKGFEEAWMKQYNRKTLL